MKKHWIKGTGIKSIMPKVGDIISNDFNKELLIIKAEIDDWFICESLSNNEKRYVPKF